MEEILLVKILVLLGWSFVVFMGKWVDKLHSWSGLWMVKGLPLFSITTWHWYFLDPLTWLGVLVLINRDPHGLSVISLAICSTWASRLWIMAAWFYRRALFFCIYFFRRNSIKDDEEVVLLWCWGGIDFWHDIIMTLVITRYFTPSFTIVVALSSLFLLTYSFPSKVGMVSLT